MKALSQFPVYLLLLVVMMMMIMMTAMMVQAYGLFGETNADPDLPTIEHGGILYYLKKDRFTDVKLAQKNCAADGGKLAEIDTWSKFYFIEDYLKSIRDQGIYLAYIGGQYLPGVSEWRFPSSGEPVRFFRPSWYIENFDTKRNLHCLALRYESVKTDRFYMDAVSCSAEGTYWERYMCEKVHASYYKPNSTLLPYADLFIAFLEFRDKIYYIHKKPFTDFYRNLYDCKADGGTLAEIDDWYEFVVVQKYLNMTSYSGRLNRVAIGGEKSSLGWVLPSNNRPLPYVDWGNLEFHESPEWNCLSFMGTAGWYMAAIACQYNPTTDYRFLCEKPKGS